MNINVFFLHFIFYMKYLKEIVLGKICGQYMYKYMYSTIFSYIKKNKEDKQYSIYKNSVDVFTNFCTPSLW